MHQNVARTVAQRQIWAALPSASTAIHRGLIGIHIFFSEPDGHRITTQIRTQQRYRVDLSTVFGSYLSPRNGFTVSSALSPGTTALLVSAPRSFGLGLLE